MRFIYVPLVIMLSCSILTMLINDQTISYGNFGTNYTADNQTGTQTINGTETTYGTEDYSLTAEFDLGAGILVVVAGSLILVIVLGVTVLGSGMKEYTVRTVYTCVVLYALWFLVSVLGIVGLSTIPIFGYLTYFVLTLFYSLGCISEVSGTGTGGRG